MIFLKIQITPFLKKWFKVGLNIRADLFAGIFSLQEKRGLFSKQDDYQKCLIFKVLGYTFIQWLLISLHLIYTLYIYTVITDALTVIYLYMFPGTHPF